MESLTIIIEKVIEAVHKAAILPEYSPSVLPNGGSQDPKTEATTSEAFPVSFEVQR